jgi:disease resistance protein
MKVKLPKKWVQDKKVEAIMQMWLDAYNKKHPEDELPLDRIRFTEKNGTLIPRYGAIATCCQDYQDIFVVIEEIVAAEAEDPSLLKCYRYGCGVLYREEDNVEGCCRYHEGYPVFHDCVKWWSCCPSRKHCDWEDFMAEPPCCTGMHSNVKPKKIEAPQEAIPEPLFKGERPENFETPEEQALREEAEAKAAEEAEQEWEPDVAPDHTAVCANLACQQKFSVLDNHDGACNYHPGPLIFHDCKKGYGCCNRTTYDFDDFLKLPTCASGPHVPKMRKVVKKQ